MSMRPSFYALGVIFFLLAAPGCAVTQVQETAGARVDDKVITATIKSLYAESKNVAITNISVETLYGVVLLSGFAKSQEEKIAAEYIAIQVDGVRVVQNEIAIQHCASQAGTPRPICQSTSEEGVGFSDRDPSSLV